LVNLLLHSYYLVTDISIIRLFIYIGGDINGSKSRY